MSYEKPELIALNLAAKAVRSHGSDGDNTMTKKSNVSEGSNSNDANGNSDGSGATSSTNSAYEADE